ncbi:Uncharacterised protein [Mycobacterium tuberculosis]|nr:Uncharacterised protein [Mycobacterium tuberculosis]CKR58035.1 Uncharacterised protein [Mycobacterium tuberculosis]COW38001.1 Uncharacterised protein [Mycobacterium tuberculosis]COX13193.1 Uncharacterised protein [Mycobacterium tuberculosis]
MHSGNWIAVGKLQRKSRFATSAGEHRAHRSANIAPRRNLAAFVAFGLYRGHDLGVDAHAGVEHRPPLTAVDQPDAAPLLVAAVVVEQLDELVGGSDRVRGNP